MYTQRRGEEEKRANPNDRITKNLHYCIIIISLSVSYNTAWHTEYTLCLPNHQSSIIPYKGPPTSPSIPYTDLHHPPPTTHHLGSFIIINQTLNPKYRYLHMHLPVPERRTITPSKSCQAHADPSTDVLFVYCLLRFASCRVPLPFCFLPLPPSPSLFLSPSPSPIIIVIPLILRVSWVCNIQQ